MTGEASLNPHDATLQREAEIEVIIDAVVAAQRAGKPADIDAIVRDHPSHENDLRRLLPVVLALEMAPTDAGRGGPASVSSGGDVSPKGRQLGDFRLIREVGRGGMGVVYEAEQLSLERRVALKVLPMANILDERQLTRFKNEVRAAATLTHPNIVPVHAVGSASGTHFYAMQFIEGQSLAEVIATLRRELRLDVASEQLAGTKTRRFAARVALAPENACVETARLSPQALPQPETVDEKPASDTVPIAKFVTELSRRSQDRYRAVVRLAADVAAATEYAHSMGIVHRDIKPANLLLDRQGKVWVADFGLAQLDADAGLTMTGDVVGTLRYMSPEQAEGHRGLVDHRTDIYALGLTLYELLTLHCAFPATNRSELHKQVLEENPRPPRYWDAKIPRDLETIVLKAISKDPRARYPTAQQFADDLRRFLNDEAIVARRPSSMERTARWARRHRTLVITSALIAISLLAGTGASLWQAIQATAERNRAIAAEKRAEGEAKRANHEARTAAAINAFLSDDLLAQANPDNEPNRDVRLRDVIDRAANALGGRFKDQPLVEASIRDTLGDVYLRLGQYQQAEDHVRNARDLHLRKLGKDNPSTLASTNRLAAVLATRGSAVFKNLTPLAEQPYFPEAQAMVDEALSGRRKVLGDEHPDTLESMHTAAFVAHSRGRKADAESRYRDTLQISKRVLGNEHTGTLKTMHNLATVLMNRRQFDEAENLLREVVGTRTRILKSEHPTTLGATCDLSNLLNSLGRFAEAENLSRECLEQMQRVLGEEHPWTLNAMENVAGSVMGQGRWSDAERLYGDLSESLQRVYGDKAHRTLEARKWMADAKSGSGQHAEAEKLYREVLPIQRRELGNDDPLTLATASNLAIAIRLQGRLEEAEELVRETLVTQRVVAGPENLNTISTTFHLGLIALMRQRYPEAENLTRDVLIRRRQTLGEEHPHTVDAKVILYNAVVNQGRLSEAEKLLSELLHVRRSVLGENHPDTLELRGALASLRSRWAWKLATDADVDNRDPRKAVQLARQAVELEPENTRHSSSLGVALYRAGNWHESVEKLETAGSKLEGGAQPHHMFLAMAHWQLGNEKAASELYAEAAAWIAAHRSGNKEQKRFRAEAEQLLGLTESDRNDLIAHFYANVDPDDFQALIESGDWHHAHGDHEKAVEDFTAALRLQPEPKDSTVWLSRGLAYYALEQYDQAVRDFSNAIEQTPEDTMVWLRLAPILVLADDATGYAAFCGRMVQQFAGSNNPEIAEKVIKACLLRADSINTERLPVETLARAMDEGTAPEWMWPWGWSTRALVAYRSGDAKSAVTFVAQSEQFNPNELAHAMNLAVLAMAQHQLGRSERAQLALAEATQIVTKDTNDKADHNLLIAQILLREAEALIITASEP